jgi:hypothetical protein
MIKFLFLQGKRDKAIHHELAAVLTEEAVSVDTVTRWCGRFKNGLDCRACIVSDLFLIGSWLFSSLSLTLT